MTSEVWWCGRWWVKDWLCCGLLWQVVKGSKQGAYWNVKPTCPRCKGLQIALQ